MMALPAVAAPPANDSCAAATALTLSPSSVTQDVREATTDPSDPVLVCAPAGSGKTVWYTFTPTKTDVYTFTSSGSPVSDYIPVLQVFTGNCGSLTPVTDACGSQASGLILNQGVKYTIVITAQPVVIEPEIHIFINGFDPCETIQPGPGGGTPGCPDPFQVRVGDSLTAVAFNRYSNAPIFASAGTFAWTLGGGAQPASGTEASLPFKYTEPVDSASVQLQFVAAGMTLNRTARVKVLGPASERSEEEPVAFRRNVRTPNDETVTLPSPGGSLRFSVFPSQLTYSYRYQIPSVAYASGVNTFFISDLVVTNWTNAEAKFYMKFIDKDSGESTTVGPLPIPPYGTREFPSVLKDTFGKEGVGTLIIESTQPVLPGSRTYSPAPKGTNGQFALGYDLSTHTLEYGEFGLLTGLRHDDAFRTNLGFFAKGSGRCIAEVALYDQDGKNLGTNPVRLELVPDIYRQEPLRSLFGTGDLRGVSVRVTAATQGCQVGAVAYVIDNESSDPYVVPMRK
jgi:hypothetical protein